MALVYNTVTPTPAPDPGDLTVTFVAEGLPASVGGMAVLVTRNGVVQDHTAVATGAETVTLTLPAASPVEDWGADAELFECRYPVDYILSTAGLTYVDVQGFVSLPLMDPTDTQAARALAAAKAWARERSMETDLSADQLALWEMAVLNFAWSLLTRGSQPVLSLDTSETSTHWGAIGGLNPSDEFLQAAEMLLAEVGSWAGPKGHPMATDALTDAMDAYADEVPISLRRW